MAGSALAAVRALPTCQDGQSHVSPPSFSSESDSDFGQTNAGQDMIDTLHSAGVLQRLHVVHAGKAGGKPPHTLVPWDTGLASTGRSCTEPWDITTAGKNQAMTYLAARVVKEAPAGTRAGIIVVDESAIEAVRALAKAMRCHRLPTVIVLCRRKSTPRCLRTEGCYLQIAAESDANMLVQPSCQEDLIADFPIRVEQVLRQHKVNQQRAASLIQLRRANSQLTWLSVDRTIEGFPPVDDTLPGQVDVGVEVQDLKLKAFLGRGSMGEVFVAHTTTSQQPVAVKIVPKEKLHNLKMVESVFNECIAAQNLQHPHIATIFDLMHGPNHVFIVQELAGSRNLSTAMKEEDGGKFDRDIAAPIFSQIASAVAYCHSKGVVHCDVKPENVALSSCLKPAAVAKLLDFGMAQPADEECEDAGGSMPFVAPEVLLTRRWWPSPTDIWSLGMVLLEMCAGINFLRAMINQEKPWTPDRASARAIAELVADFSDFSVRYEQLINMKMPACFWELVSKMMQLDPQRRPLSIEVVEAEWCGPACSDRLIGS